MRSLLHSLPDTDVIALLYDWRFWARPCVELIPATATSRAVYGGQMMPPGDDWLTWFIMAGRGYGKTRIGAETTRDAAVGGQYPRIGIVGRTASDVRDVMIEGPSGLLSVSPPWAKPKYEPSKRRVTWANGTVATTYTADEPDELRGPEHFLVWADEIAAWRFRATWDNLKFGLRQGRRPIVVATSTPRPIPIVKDIISDPDTVITKGTTYENRDNLAPAFVRQIVRRYEGTRLGRQELLGQLLEDNPNALWTHELLESLRVTAVPPLREIAVAIDPAKRTTEEASETGIVAAGIDGSPADECHGFVLEDASLKGKPHEWAGAAVALYHKLKANVIVAETNNGGDMVEATVRAIDPDVRFVQVTATRGKFRRAEPIATLYEQRRVHHVGYFRELEDQMTEWDPAMDAEIGRDSEGDVVPLDRMDALVWALTHLMDRQGGRYGIA